MCMHIYAQENMTNITLKIPDELKNELKSHEEVNWSAVIRKALVEHLRKIQIAEAIAKKSKLSEKDAEEISKKINSSLAKKLKIR